MFVNINKLKYEIIEEGDGDNVYLCNKDDKMCMGLTLNAIQKIYIHKDLSYEMKRHTLAHELCYAFLFTHGIDYVEKSEEMICNFVALYHERITEIVNCYFLKER